MARSSSWCGVERTNPACRRALRLHVGHAAPVQNPVLFSQLKELVLGGYDLDMPISEDIGSLGIPRLDDGRDQTVTLEVDEPGGIRIEEVPDPRIALTPAPLNARGCLSGRGL